MGQTIRVVEFLENKAPYSYANTVNLETGTLEDIDEANATNLWWTTLFRGEESLSLAPLTPKSGREDGVAWNVVTGDITIYPSVMKRTIRKGEETIYELKPLSDEHLAMFPAQAVGLQRLFENDRA